jgi:DNA-binding NarL/FixJ family response regulator
MTVDEGPPAVCTDDPELCREPIRVLLGDPHRALVEAVAMRLSVEPDLVVVGAVERPEEVLRIAGTSPVDLAVLTVGTEDDFLDIGGRLRQLSPGLGLVAVGECDDVEVVERALRHGFSGWVPRTFGVTALLDSVRAVRRGETWIPPLLLTRLLPHLLDQQRGDPGPEEPFASLTARELDVLRAMARGVTRQDIADDLGISANTVRTHTQKILAKLGVHTSLAAVALARRAGWVDHHDHHDRKAPPAGDGRY